MGQWSTWVSTNEAHARASGRRGYNKKRREAAQARRRELHRLVQRWGTSAAAKVKLATALKVSVNTIRRDLQAIEAQPVIPLICPTCGLPSRLDVDPNELTDDPQELAALEQAFAKLIGMVEGRPVPRRRRAKPPIERPQQALARRSG